MQESKFVAVDQYLSSISTEGRVQYVQVLENINKSKFKFIIDIDLDGHTVSITAPNGEIQKQDIRENTERANKASKWYKKAKQSYSRFTEVPPFTPTYKK